MARKRKNGDGTWRTIQKPNGTVVKGWRVPVGEDIYGNVELKWFYGKTEKICRQKYADYMEQLSQGIIVSEDLSLGEWIRRWVKAYKEPNVSKGTLTTYWHTLNIALNDDISNRCIGEIRPIELMDFFSKYSEYSWEVLNKLRTLLRAAFEDAVDNDICIKNPMAKIKTVEGKPSREKRVFTDEEIQIITEFAKTDINGHIVLLMLLAGLRSGEVRALEWKHIDTKNAIIHIDQAAKSDGSVGLPKNGKKASVPVLTELNDVLCDWPKLSKYVASNKHSMGMIGKEGVRHRLNTFYKRLNAFRDAKGEHMIRTLTPHELRHSFDSMLHRKGMSLKSIQMLMRHKDVDMTLHYAHMNMDDLRKDVDKLERIV